MKLTGPGMSLDASGTFGKTLVFSKWKGKNYGRLRVTPMNPKTDSMAQTRTYLGALGQALSSILTRAKDMTHVGSAFWAAAVSYAPAGQSWISYAMKTILGTNFGNISAAITAYTAVGATPKGYYVSHAADLGLTDFSLSYGSAAAIVAGAQLYMIYKFAVEQLSYTAPAGGIASPTTSELGDFVTWCNTAA